MFNIGGVDKKRKNSEKIVFGLVFVIVFIDFGFEKKFYFWLSKYRVLFSIKLENYFGKFAVNCLSSNFSVLTTIINT